MTMGESLRATAMVPGSSAQTTAQASQAARVVGTFPAASHPPIRYPLALLKTSRSRDAAAFRAFLLARQARAIFARHGFTAP